MQARMKQPAMLIPEAMAALQSLHKSIEVAGLPAKTAELVNLRASQINGCAMCVDGHVRILRKLGETDERMHGVVAWREMPYYTPAERAALALTEALTRIADAPEGVPDDVWNEAKLHYDEKPLAGLVLQIAAINVWNRLNVATRQVVGAVKWAD